MNVLISVTRQITFLGGDFPIYKIIIAGGLILVGLIWFITLIYWLLKKRLKKTKIHESS